MLLILRRLLEVWTVTIQVIRTNNQIMPETAVINIKRLFYVALFAIPVHIAHILVFGLTVTPTNPAQASWRLGILSAHALLLILMICIGASAYRLRQRNTPCPSMYILQFFAVLVIVLAGIAIVAIDQLVTPSITPFVVICTIAGALFLLRPLIAIPMYVLAYAIFYVVMGINQTDPSVLTSNRVNGITIVGISICLSMILWKANLVNLMQTRQIEKQQRELEEKNRELKTLAHYDFTTGLVNRHFFDELFRREVNMMKRYGHRSSLIVMDIDFFKRVNDRYGHPGGDMILREFASLLTKSLRNTDIIARWGGEEFIILLPNTPPDHSITISESLRRGISTHAFAMPNGTARITASFGVAEIDPHKPDPFQNAYREADHALYSAKQAGRNRVRHSVQGI